ncbi:VanZ family protein [Parvibaculum sp.]|uniref:VanZ family protein n=1 Tax=Parvibaculum sp. TaxID=2024848 RepID=UPI00329687AA
MFILQFPLFRSLAVLVAVTLYLLILFGSVSTELGPPNLFSHFDKFVHMTAWAILAAVSVLALRHRQACLIGAVLLFVSSGAVELVQAYIPGRTASYGDLLANALGIFLGGFLAWSYIWQRLTTHTQA